VWTVTFIAVASFIPTLPGASPLYIAEAASWTLGVMAVASIGALVVSRRRSLVQGWLLVAFSLALSIGFYAYHFLRLPEADPHADLAASQRLIAIGDSAFVLAIFCLLLLVLLVPDGRLPSRRWRPVVWALTLLATVMVTRTVVGSRGVVDFEAWLARSNWMSGDGSVPNPGTPVFSVALPIIAMTVITLDAMALWRRMRVSTDEERQQVKWVIWGCGAVLGWFLIWQPQPGGGWFAVVQRLAPGIALVCLATGFGMALFKHKLWDIDLVMRRSVVYGVLWLAIAAVYLAVAWGLGLVAGAQFPLEVALGLTVVATLVFQPARRRLERLADRWVFGRKESPIAAVHTFGEGVAVSSRPQDIASELANTATRALGLGWAEVAIDGSAPAWVGSPNPEPETIVPIARGDERFGLIRCRPHRGEKLDDEDLALLEALAGQAALALSHLGLASRIVHAEEQERRRIERNIHDGAQQDLATLAARLGMTQAKAHDDADLVGSLAQIRAEVQHILANLRELAQGIHPSVLRDGGLAAAIEDRCSRLPMDVDLVIDPGLRGLRLPGDTEAAAYFFVAEALANTMKHSGSSAVRVAVDLDETRLRVEVGDNGTGFDPAAVPSGSGLTGLSDRIRAVGGTMTIDSGRGVTVVAELPAVVEDRR
jgi:signal transduction histidine kinase